MPLADDRFSLGCVLTPVPRCAPASAAEARKAGETNLPGPDIVIEGASKWGAIQTAMDICANDGAVVVVARHYDAPDFNPVRPQPPFAPLSCSWAAPSSLCPSVLSPFLSAQQLRPQLEVG